MERPCRPQDTKRRVVSDRRGLKVADLKGFLNRLALNQGVGEALHIVLMDGKDQ